VCPLSITKESIIRDLPLNIAVTGLLIHSGMKHSIFGI
jgi:hypothetical protein